MSTQSSSIDYAGCKGCIEFDCCDYVKEHDIAKDCPCLECLIKMICKHMCSKYELHHQVGEMLLSERPFEDGG